MKKTFLLVDDHALIRSAMKTIILEEFGDVKIKEAESEKEAMSIIQSNKIGIMITDLNMPDSDAMNLVSYAARLQPDMIIVVLTVEDEGIYAKRFLKLGVKGFLNKAEPEAVIKQALHACLGGSTFISEKIKQILLDSLLHENQDNPFDRLSNREMQVAQLMLKGNTLTKIADQLALSISSVSTHKTNIFDKLQIANRSHIEFISIAKKISRHLIL